MVRILIVSSHYKKKSPGGASQSIINIFEVLKEISHFNVKFLHPSLGKFKNFLLPPDISSYFFIPKILREIKKFKPHIIITQMDIGKAAIISGRIKKIPVINIIRDTSSICPKKVDSINYGNACLGLTDRKTCFNCIDSWRSLRVKLGYDKKGWPYSLNANFSIMFYKIKYFICRMNFFLYNRATINLVASELMKSILSKNVNPNKIKVFNITPIEKSQISNSIEKKNQLLFIINFFEENYKGLDFILELSKFIPKNYKIIIIGRKLSAEKIKEFIPKITNFGYIMGDRFDYLYQTSKILLIPTFCTEAFGRAVIESIINKTLVISSPNCGVNYYFKDRDFIKIVPLNTSLWIKAIKETLQNPYQITDEDVNLVYEPFSMQKCKEDFIALIQDIIK